VRQYTRDEESLSLVMRRELRRAAEPPALPRTREELELWPARYEDALDDRFGYRSLLIRWHNVAEMLWLRARPNDRIVVGQDGWIFLGDEEYVAYQRNQDPLTEGELRNWKHVLEQRRDWLASQGIAYVFVVAPNKSAIYPEHWPAQFNAVNGYSRLDQLTRYLKRNSDVVFVDLRRALLEAKEQGDLLYFEHGTHWNDRGAFIAYRETLKALGIPGLEPRPRSDFVEVPGRGRPDSWADRLHMSDLLRQEFVELEPRNREKLRRSAVDDVPGKSEVHESGDPGAPRLVMFRDSFGAAMMDFLSPHFSRASYLYQPERLLLKSFVEEERPDVVIQEVVEYVLRSRPVLGPEWESRARRGKR
jgi:hypothetical protein